MRGAHFLSLVAEKTLPAHTYTGHYVCVYIRLTRPAMFNLTLNIGVDVRERYWLH